MIDDKGSPAEPEMKIGLPALSQLACRHQLQAHRVGQGQVLVTVLAHQGDAGLDFRRPGREYGERCQVFDEGHELQRAIAVVALEKPAMPLGDDQAGGGELRRRGE